MTSAESKVSLEILKYMLSLTKRVGMAFFAGRLERELGLPQAFIPDAVCPAILKGNRLLQLPETLLLPLNDGDHLLVAHLVATPIVRLRDLNLQAGVGCQLPKVRSGLPSLEEAGAESWGAWRPPALPSATADVIYCKNDKATTTRTGIIGSKKEYNLV